MSKICFSFVKLPRFYYVENVELEWLKRLNTFRLEKL